MDMLVFLLMTVLVGWLNFLQMRRMQSDKEGKIHG
jgi:hypothetical protein